MVHSIWFLTKISWILGGMESAQDFVAHGPILVRQYLMTDSFLILVAVEDYLLKSNLLIIWQQVWNKKQMDCLVNSNTELGQVDITWHSADSNMIQILHNTHKPQDMFFSEWLPDVFSHFWYSTAQKVFG